MDEIFKDMIDKGLINVRRTQMNFIERLAKHPEIEGSCWLLMTIERFVTIPVTDYTVYDEELFEVFEDKCHQLRLNVN